MDYKLFSFINQSYGTASIVALPSSKDKLRDGLTWVSN